MPLCTDRTGSSRRGSIAIITIQETCPHLLVPPGQLLVSGGPGSRGQEEEGGVTSGERRGHSGGRLSDTPSENKTMDTFVLVYSFPLPDVLTVCHLVAYSDPSLSGPGL